MIDINLLDQLLVKIVLVSWLQMEPVLMGFREYTVGSDARFEGRGSSVRHPHLSGFEYLYNELRKRENARISLVKNGDPILFSSLQYIPV